MLSNQFYQPIHPVILTTPDLIDPNSILPHLWAPKITHLALNKNPLRGNRTIILQMIDAMRIFVANNETTWKYRATSSADIRHIIFALGKVAQSEILLNDDIEIMKHHMPWIVRLAVSLTECLETSTQPHQEISNTIVSLGYLASAKWLTTQLDYNLKMRVLNFVRECSFRFFQPLHYHEHITQNISTILFTFHLMEKAEVFPKDGDYSFITTLINSVQHMIGRNGNRPSQDIRFFIQGITSIARQGLLPRDMNYTTILNIAQLLFQFDIRTEKLSEQIENVITCLIDLAQLGLLPNIRTTTPNLLLELINYCLFCMQEQNQANLKEKFLNILSILNKMAELGCIDTSYVSTVTHLKKILEQTELSRTVLDVVQATLTNDIKQLIHKRNSQPTSLPPQANLNALATSWRPPIFDLKQWHGVVLNIAEKSANERASFPLHQTPGANIDFLINSAIAFVMANKDEWKNRKNKLYEISNIIHDLGLLAVRQYTVPQSYFVELPVLFNCLSEAIENKEDNLSDNQFTQEIQLALIGLRNMLNSRSLFMNEIKTINYSFIPSTINRLATSLKTSTAHSTAKLSQIASFLHSIGVMATMGVLPRNVDYQSIIELLNLVLSYSQFINISNHDVKNTFDCLIKLIKTNILPEDKRLSETLLRLLLIPFENKVPKTIDYTKTILNDLLCPNLILFADMKFLFQGIDSQTMKTICSLYIHMNRFALMNRNEVPIELIASTSNNIYELIKKQINAMLFADQNTIYVVNLPANPPLASSDTHLPRHEFAPEFRFNVDSPNSLAIMMAEEALLEPQRTTSSEEFDPTSGEVFSPQPNVF